MNEEYQLIKYIEGPKVHNRQQLPKVFAENGAMMWAKSAWLKRNNHFIGEGTKGFVMEPEISADLDTPLDWEWVEFLMSRKK